MVPGLALLSITAGAALEGWYTPPERVAVVVSSLPGEGRTLRISALVTAAERAFAAHTSLETLSAEQAGVSVESLLSCARSERVACWLQRLEASEYRYLLWLSVSWDSERDRSRIGAVWIDVKEGQLALTRPTDERDAALDRAIHWSPARPTASLDRFFHHLVRDELSLNHRRGSELVVRSDCQGCVLEMGVRSFVTPAAQDTLRIRGVPPGSHLVRLQAAEGAWCDRTVQLGEDMRITLELATCSSPPPPAYGISSAATIPGVLAGAALVATGFAVSTGGPTTVCIPAPGRMDCSGGSGIPATAALIPVGAALAGGGAALEFTRSRPSWWWVVGGAVVGAAAASATWFVVR